MPIKAELKLSRHEMTYDCEHEHQQRGDDDGDDGDVPGVGSLARVLIDLARRGINFGCESSQREKSRNKIIINSIIVSWPVICG